jgi:hypothetical protein
VTTNSSTLPYTPNVQPIELIWAYVKNYVARQYESGRSMEILRQQTMEGFYGQLDLKHEGVTATLSSDLIKHSHKWCNDFIDQDWELEGVLQHLSIGDDSTTVEINILEDIHEDMDPFAGEIEDEYEDDQEA